MINIHLFSIVFELTTFVWVQIIPKVHDIPTFYSQISVLLFMVVSYFHANEEEELNFSIAGAEINHFLPYRLNS